MRASDSLAGVRHRFMRPRATMRVPQSPEAGKRRLPTGLCDFGARQQQDQPTARFRIEVVRAQQRAESRAARIPEIEHEPVSQPRVRHELGPVFGLRRIDEFPAGTLICNPSNIAMHETSQRRCTDNQPSKRKRERRLPRHICEPWRSGSREHNDQSRRRDPARCAIVKRDAGRGFHRRCAQNGRRPAPRGRSASSRDRGRDCRAKHRMQHGLAHRRAESAHATTSRAIDQARACRGGNASACGRYPGLNRLRSRFVSRACCLPGMSDGRVVAGAASRIRAWISRTNDADAANLRRFISAGATGSERRRSSRFVRNQRSLRESLIPAVRRSVS
jgi:hypothetical protein